MEIKEKLIQALFGIFSNGIKSDQLFHFSLSFPSITLLKLLEIKFGVSFNLINIDDGNQILKEKLNEIGFQISDVKEQLSQELKTISEDEKESLKHEITKSKKEILDSLTRIERKTAEMDNKLDQIMMFVCKDEKVMREIEKVRNSWLKGYFRLFEKAIQESYEKNYVYSIDLFSDLLNKIELEKKDHINPEDPGFIIREDIEKLEMYAFYYKGMNYFATKNYELSFYNVIRAVNQGEKIGVNPKLLSGLNSNSGLTLFLIGVKNGSPELIVRSMQLIESAQKLDPNNVNAFNNMGHIFIQFNLYAEAVPLLRQAIFIDNKIAIPHNNLGAAIFHLSKYLESATEFRKAIELNPNYPDAHGNLGNALNKLNNYKDAEREYRKAIELDPNYAHPHCHLGSLLRILERYEEAEKEYREALRINPDYADAHNNLGNLFFELKRYEEAQSEYRKTLLINPEYPNAISMLNKMA